MKFLGLQREDGSEDEDEDEDEDEHEDENDVGTAENNTPNRTGYQQQDLTILGDLDELVIENMFGDLPQWERQIAQLLVKSPRLRKLGLSVSPETGHITYEDWYPNDLEDFFKRVCEQYAGMGAPPLRLRSINCGACIYPTMAGPLERLTDLAYVEEVHLRNEEIFHGGQTVVYMYDSDFECRINFDYFLSSKCPRLRRFSATWLEGDVLEALVGAPITRQLAVSFQSQGQHPSFELARAMRPDDSYVFISAPPLQVRMMDLGLKRTDEGGLSAEQVLEDLVAFNSETLEGLGVFLAENADIDAGFEDLGLLQNALARLSKLTQLSVRINIFGKSASKLSETTLERAACQIAGAVPHLRYINVYWMFWRIWRDHGPDGNASVRLELLDEREREDVELFTHCIFEGV